MPEVLFLTAYPVEDSSCRYRVHQFVPYLEAAGYECTVSSFCSPELFGALQRSGKLGVKVPEMVGCTVKRLSQLRKLRKFDIVVIHREAFPFFAPMVENWILRRHSRVVFSFDDAIYAGHEEVANLSHPRLYRWKHGKGYGEVIRGSAHVIVGNRVLADYAKRLNSNISIVPTVVDCTRYRVRREPLDGSTPITIGWVGSRSTASYLSLVGAALRRLAEIWAKRVQFRFVGCPEYKPQLPNARSLPFRLDEEIEDLHSLDIGLMPLPDTEWTRGKCAFKAIQYMASGIPVVASPVGITTDLIQNEVNGLLAASSEDWFRQLNRLVHNAGLRRDIGLSGRKTVEEGYSLQKWGPRLVELFDQLCDRDRSAKAERIAA